MTNISWNCDGNLIAWFTFESQISRLCIIISHNGVKLRAGREQAEVFEDHQAILKRTPHRLIASNFQGESLSGLKNCRSRFCLSPFILRSIWSVLEVSGDAKPLLASSCSPCLPFFFCCLIYPSYHENDWRKEKHEKLQIVNSKVKRYANGWRHPRGTSFLRVETGSKISNMW